MRIEQTMWQVVTYVCRRAATRGRKKRQNRVEGSETILRFINQLRLINSTSRPWRVKDRRCFLYESLPDMCPLPYSHYMGLRRLTNKQIKALRDNPPPFFSLTCSLARHVACADNQNVELG